MGEPRQATPEQRRRWAEMLRRLAEQEAFGTPDALAWREALLAGAEALSPAAVTPPPPARSAPAPAKSAPDPDQEALLMVDGAARGNPGPAAAGVKIEAPGLSFELGRRLGVKTNNQAEYMALLLGLAEAKRLGLRNLRIQSDSQLMVRQINGDYKVRDPGLQPLFQQALAALKGFGRYAIVHVERALNREPDRLANEALDGLWPD